TQSIGDFTVLDDFHATLQVDKFHLGMGTIATCDAIKILGCWYAPSGTEVEGKVKSFEAEAFLADAALTAASMGMVKVDGDFEGTIRLTDPESPAVPTITVRSNFFGTVISESALKKLVIKGDF